MRLTHQLVHSRTRVRPRYALMPLEGFPTSTLPQWRGAEVRILASPALGAQFIQYLAITAAGGGAEQPADGRTEAFVYVLDGAAELTVDGGPARLLQAGGFALVPRTSAYALRATALSTILMLRKVYEPAAGGVAEPELVIGNAADIPAEPFMGNAAVRLQTLIPNELSHDMAMNIFSFDPGHCLPYVETHIMEHGLYFLQGKGVYFLDGEWMEVEANDFIWMGPYCPQCFYATGPSPAKYIYYKNVNRDVVL